MSNPLEAFEKLDFQHVFDVVTEDQYKTSSEARRIKGKRHDNIRASTIGMCIRKQLLDDGEQQIEPNTELKTIFRHGNFIHDDVVYPTIEYWLKNIMGFEYNVKLLNEFPYGYEIDHEEYGTMMSRGYVDDMFMVFLNGVTTFIPIEIKSIGGGFFKLKEPELVHKCQVQLYMGLFGAKFGYVVYIHKPTWTVKTYKEEYDPEFFTSLIQRGKDLYSFKKKGIIPYAEAMVEREKNDGWFSKKFLNVEGEMDKDQCANCDYLDFCLKNKKEIHPKDEEEDW